MEQRRLLAILGVLVGVVFLWSAINPIGYGIWLLEIFPALIGIALLAITYRRFPFTNIVYVFVAIHSIILFVGGHYTYAENPLFNWLRDTFLLERNYYDRLGHLAQGFFPALIIREFLLRKTKLTRGAMLTFLVLSVALAFSASYELLEWGAAVTLTPETGNAFLGTQGDIWDSQWDMLLALLGASAALLLCSRTHDRQMKHLLPK